jgi:hypothetical protein
MTKGIVARLTGDGVRRLQAAGNPREGPGHCRAAGIARNVPVAKGADE